MTVVYEAANMPHGNVVVKITDGDRRNMEVVDACETLELAVSRAERLNVEVWEAARPAGAPRMVWGQDWQGRLFRIIDRPWPA